MRNDLHQHVNPRSADYITGRNFPLAHNPPVGPVISEMIKQAYRAVDSGINADLEITARVKHLMRKDETLGEFYSRTLVSRAEVLTLTSDEIANRVARADERNQDDPVRHPQFYEKRTMPKKIVL